MAYDRKDKRYEKPIAPQKPVCWRIGCQRPAKNGFLCDRHRAEMIALGQSEDDYKMKSCLPDKAKEVVKDNSKKKAFRKFGRRDEE